MDGFRIYTSSSTGAHSIFYPPAFSQSCLEKKPSQDIPLLSPSYQVDRMMSQA
jgi:hypothetical protein